MRKLIIPIIILLMFSIVVSAKVSDDFNGKGKITSFNDKYYPVGANKKVNVKETKASNIIDFNIGDCQMSATLVQEKKNGKDKEKLKANNYNAYIKVAYKLKYGFDIDLESTNFVGVIEIKSNKELVQKGTKIIQNEKGCLYMDMQDLIDTGYEIEITKQNDKNYDVRFWKEDYGVSVGTPIEVDPVVGLNVNNVYLTFIVCGNWTCLTYDSCQPDVTGGYQDCIVADGLPQPQCDDSEYAGDYSEFRQFCDYCEPEEEEANGECDIFQKLMPVTSYLTNNATCCAVTLNNTDCEVTPPYNIACGYQSSYNVSDMPKIVFDIMGVGGATFVQNIPLIILALVVLVFGTLGMIKFFAKVFN